MKLLWIHIASSLIYHIVYIVCLFPITNSHHIKMFITNILMFFKYIKLIFLHISVNTFFFSEDYPVHKKPEITATNYFTSVSTGFPFTISCLLVYLGMSTHTSVLFFLTLNKQNIQIPHSVFASSLETTDNYIKLESLWCNRAFYFSHW